MLTTFDLAGITLVKSTYCPIDVTLPVFVDEAKSLDSTLVLVGLKKYLKLAL